MLSLLLAVPSCIYSFWHSVIPTSYFIYNDFYTCFTNFLSRLSLDCSAGRDAIRSIRATRIAYTYAHAYCARELNGSCEVYMQSTIKCRRSKRKSPRWTWILLFEGQILPYYTTDTSRTKIRQSHVKIIVFRPLIWVVERLY